MSFIDVVLLAAILAAAVSIIVYMRRRRKSGSGGCDSCASCAGAQWRETAGRGKRTSNLANRPQKSLRQAAPAASL